LRYYRTVAYDGAVNKLHRLNVNSDFSGNSEDVQAYAPSISARLLCSNFDLMNSLVELHAPTVCRGESTANRKSAVRSTIHRSYSRDVVDSPQAFDLHRFAVDF
jgi:hypothetical protein